MNATPLVSVLTVGAGGALGASLRFGLYSVVRRCCDAPTSIATVLANILGCAIAGAIVACLERSTHTQLYATFLLTGVHDVFGVLGRCIAPFTQRTRRYRGRLRCCHQYDRAFGRFRCVLDRDLRARYNVVPEVQSIQRDPAAALASERSTNCIPNSPSSTYIA